MYKSVFVNDIHNQLMTSVNPEISDGGLAALFGLARFYTVLAATIPGRPLLRPRIEATQWRRSRRETPLLK